SARRDTVTARSPRSYDPTTTAFQRPADFSSTPCRDRPCCWRMERRRAPRDLAYSEGIWTPSHWPRGGLPQRSLRSVTVTAERHVVKCCYPPVSRSALLVGSRRARSEGWYTPRDQARNAQTSFNDPSREAGKEVRCGTSHGARRRGRRQDHF